MPRLSQTNETTSNTIHGSRRCCSRGLFDQKQKKPGNAAKTGLRSGKPGRDDAKNRSNEELSDTAGGAYEHEFVQYINQHIGTTRPQTDRYRREAQLSKQTELLLGVPNAL